jgi:methyltransferase (TIGR00027 family)
MAYSNNGKMSVEYRPSETAMGAATLRAFAAREAREEIRGQDNLAEIFLPEEYKSTLKNPAIREWVMKNKVAPGMYEFMIARTAFFDHTVKQALCENISQIVFLGAGYDSRSYRFKDLIKDTRIFELDIQPTQQRKKELLTKAGISIPDQVLFVSINFNTDDMGDVLSRAGFSINKRTLIVWEGVTYYLSARVVDDTLSVISTNSPPGSMICFDYASLSPEIMNNESVKKLKETMKSNYPGEPTQFGIKYGEIESFLSVRGYKLIEHINSKDMEKKYLNLHDGSSAGEIPALFCLLLASVSDNKS